MTKTSWFRNERAELMCRCAFIVRHIIRNGTAFRTSSRRGAEVVAAGSAMTFSNSPATEPADQPRHRQDSGNGHDVPERDGQVLVMQPPTGHDQPADAVWADAADVFALQKP